MNEARVTYKDGKFLCKCSFETREIPKKAGFRWDNEKKIWFTENTNIAAQLLDICDTVATTKINKHKIIFKEWGGILLNEERLYPFQREAARFALSRNRSYLALEPGLGKTPIAISILKTLKAKAVYICPPFLTRNTEEEFKRWAVNLVTVRPPLPKSFDLQKTDVLIIPDSLLTNSKIYDIITAFLGLHNKEIETWVIVDEAHRFKTASAQRTKAIFGSKGVEGVASKADRVLYLSGTPMPNRPMELFPVLNHSAPETIEHRNMWEYGKKYCAAFETTYGWDFSGASNLEELRSRVRDTFMLRMKKAEVLKDLPPKIEDMVLLSADLPYKQAALDREILKVFSPEDLMKKQISVELEDNELHLATYRRELGLAKVDEALTYIKFILEEGEESVLIFAIHTEVIAQLHEGLKDFEPLTITGQTPMAKRHQYVNEFQTNPSRRVFIGNVQAAGVGLTLTKATRVIFVEFAWTPAENDQASDRAHRIGQRDSVFVQYLVFRNSVDRMVLETIFRKRKVIDAL